MYEVKHACIEIRASTNNVKGYLKTEILLNRNSKDSKGHDYTCKPHE